MNRNQKGIGIINVLLYIVIVAFIVIYGLKIGSGYIDKNIVAKAVAATLVENKNRDTINSNVIKKSIIDKVSVNNIDLENDDIVVTKIDSGFEVEINFKKEIKINNNMALVMSFDIEDSTP